MLRVSTEDQAKEGFSIAAQVKRLNAYCKAGIWIVAGQYIDEGHSGRSIERPAYEAMMSEIDKWDVLVVLKMDRIHRNSVNFPLVVNALRDAGKEFNSMQESFDTTTAMGRFVMDIIQRIAQLESDPIGERVKVGMTQKAKKGKGLPGFPAPYGYAWEGHKYGPIARGRSCRPAGSAGNIWSAVSCFGYRGQTELFTGADKEICQVGERDRVRGAHEPHIHRLLGLEWIVQKGKPGDSGCATLEQVRVRLASVLRKSVSNRHAIPALPAATLV